MKILLAKFREIVLDVKGMSKATTALLRKLHADRRNDGCAPYWLIVKELGLPICSLYLRFFDRVLGACPS